MTTAKSVSKRIRITKNGKVVRRPMAVDHFRTRKNGKQVQSRRKTRSIDYPIRKLLNY
jgi:ribosomal protein L35